MSSSLQDSYKFQWNNGYSFDRLKSVPLAHLEGAMRLATIWVQKARVCFVVSRERGFQYIPYLRQNEQWVRVPARDVKVDSVTDAIFESEEVFIAGMERQMLLQFRTLMTGYYEDYPTQDTIKEEVRKDPRKSTLIQQKYLFYVANVQRDEEFDGAYEVYCDGGFLLIPYVGDPAKENVKLLVDYANFVPGMDSETLLERWGKRIDKVSTVFSNMHWHNIRNAIERLWGSNG